MPSGIGHKGISGDTYKILLVGVGVYLKCFSRTVRVKRSVMTRRPLVAAHFASGRGGPGAGLVRSLRDIRTGVSVSGARKLVCVMSCPGTRKSMESRLVEGAVPHMIKIAAPSKVSKVICASGIRSRCRVGGACKENVNETHYAGCCRCAV